MKKMFCFLTILIIFFCFNSLNSKAITESAFNNSTSFDIGNFMSNNYYRWKCDPDTKQCEKTQTKTKDDFGTESECKTSCNKNINNSFAINNDFNYNLSYQTTTTTKASYNSFNSFDISNNFQTTTTTKPTYTNQSLSGLSGLDLFTITTKPITPQNNPPLDVSSLISGFSLNKDMPLTIEKQEQPKLINNGLISGLLEGLGIVKPNSLLLDEEGNNSDISKQGVSSGSSNSSSLSGYIWYFEDYAFNITNNNSNKNYNYDSYISLRVSTYMKRLLEGRYEHVGILYSYINEKNERVFDNVEYTEWIKVQQNTKGPTEWQADSNNISIKVPRDIKVVDNNIEIEFFVVILPAYYEHFKIPANDYKNWKETKKVTLSFAFTDNQSWQNYLRTNCKFSFVEPESKSTFTLNKDPYHTNLKLSVEMSCNELLKTKNKPDPDSLLIYYKMDCPQHFNTDHTNESGYYDSVFVNNNKSFNIDFHGMDFTKSIFTQKFILENDSILSLLQKRYAPYNYNQYGLSKRCDITASIFSHNTLLAEIKDYFYLNQCKINVVNEHPDWVYCTEDKDGNHFPITAKIVFSNCVKDIPTPSVDYINFNISPNPKPYEQYPTIKDNAKYEIYPWIQSEWFNTEKNGQIIYVDLNNPIEESQIGWWKEYFQWTDVVKDMASNPSRLSFALSSYFNVDGSIFRPPMENWGSGDQFKIYYGSNYEKCDNNPKDTDGPIPVFPGDDNEDSKKDSEAKPNVLTRIVDFFKSWFK